jgi:hypothetical protein
MTGEWIPPKAPTPVRVVSGAISGALVVIAICLVLLTVEVTVTWLQAQADRQAQIEAGS